MKLDAQQFGILRDLVAIPSWRKNFAESPADPIPLCDERQAMQYIKGYLMQNSDAKEIQFSPDPKTPDRKNSQSILFERGTGTEFTLLFTGHIDTVAPSWEAKIKEMLTLKRDGNYLHGLGAFDMKAGIMAMMYLLCTANVPKGMKIIGAFLNDEEGNSSGAKELLQWQGLNQVDLVLSPEIATLVRSESDSPKDVIMARVGNVKTKLEIRVPQGHAFDPRRTDAAAEFLAAHNAMAALPWRTHKYFNHSDGRKLVEFMRKEEGYGGKPSGLSTCTVERGNFVQFILPPNPEKLDEGGTVMQAYEAQARCMRQLESQREWARKGISYTFEYNTDREHYEPYITDKDHPYAQLVLKSVRNVYGGANVKSGLSTSDGNILSGRLQQLPKKPPFIELGPIGSGAHEVGEKVDAASIIRYINWAKTAIAHHIPEGIIR